MLDSLLINVADKTSVPAGQALAVDREEFSKTVTKNLEENPNIEIIRKEFGKEESIKNLIFKDIDIFKEILPILPENDFVLNDEHITPIIVKHKRMRLFQREIPTFTKNVLSKFIDLIKYKNYKKDKSNLEYIIG